MSSQPLAPSRRDITFAQAEGLEPLPSQLRRGEISSELRAQLFAYLYNLMLRDKRDHEYRSPVLSGAWLRMLRGAHVALGHLPVDEFDDDFNTQVASIKEMIFKGDYHVTFGIIEWFIRHPSRPEKLAQDIDRLLVVFRAAYRVIDNFSIVPIATDAEHAAVVSALASLGEAGLDGPRSHLRTAGSMLTAGRYSDSVRESISAVEGAIRALTGKSKLSDGLAEIQKHTGIHRSLAAGFDKLYGWTSDEQGIRHALYAEPEAKVDEADALFMFGACSSFLTYLVGKGRAAGLTPS